MRASPCLSLAVNLGLSESQASLFDLIFIVDDSTLTKEELMQDVDHELDTPKSSSASVASVAASPLLQPSPRASGAHRRPSAANKLRDKLMLDSVEEPMEYHMLVKTGDALLHWLVHS